MTDDETWVDADHANTLNAFDIGDTRTTHAIVGHGVSQGDEDVAGTLCTNAQGGQRTTDIAGAYVSAQTFSVYPEGGNGADLAAAEVDKSPALTKVKSERGVHVAETMSVRRLTPIECERLMGWPDNWTAPDGIKAPDSKRYAARGDGIVSWVAYWIGCRIQMIEAEGEANDAAA